MSVVAAATNRPRTLLTELGRQFDFYFQCLRSIPRGVRRYRRETLNILAEMAFGVGALALVGGTVGVMAALAYAVGTEVGLQGYSALDQIGAANFAAFLSAYFNTREAAPLIAGVALAAAVGCGFTAQLGAMRVSEEVDALEVMAVPPVGYLVVPRIVAGVVTVIPVYAIGLFASFFASRLITTAQFDQSVGTYDHYFQQYLVPADVMYSFLKVLMFAVLIILIHCYYGYHASGGPAGVGVAVGRAIRTSIVSIVLFDFFFSLAVWGSTTTVRITG